MPLPTLVPDEVRPDPPHIDVPGPIGPGSPSPALSATRSAASEPHAPDRSSDAPPVAELREVGRRFGDVVALDGVTLGVSSGSLVGIIGPSGAGKTTAVRLLTGGLRPTSGTAAVFGEDPTRLGSATRERIGFMPQQLALYDDLTVAENLDFVGSLFGLFRPRRRRRIAAMLAWLELGEARDRRAAALSGGMRRRLQLGCALIHDPSLVFLDEPTGGIDPIVRQVVWTELRRLRDAGRTLVVTTQLVSEAEECDEVALFAGGRLVALATPDALRREAFGGELLEVETDALFDVDRLARPAEVDQVRQVGPRRLLAIGPDAASATPAVIAAIDAAGGSVVSIQESRPSFDEVFARLVDRSGPRPE